MTVAPTSSLKCHGVDTISSGSSPAAACSAALRSRFQSTVWKQNGHDPSGFIDVGVRYRPQAGQGGIAGHSAPALPDRSLRGTAFWAAGDQNAVPLDPGSDRGDAVAFAGI